MTLFRGSRLISHRGALKPPDVHVVGGIAGYQGDARSEVAIPAKDRFVRDHLLGREASGAVKKHGVLARQSHVVIETCSRHVHLEPRLDLCANVCRSSQSIQLSLPLPLPPPLPRSLPRSLPLALPLALPPPLTLLLLLVLCVRA